MAANGRRAVAVLCGMLAAVGAAPFATASASATPERPASQSTAAAYSFLDAMMDKYATGSRLRLVQSFQPQPALNYRASVTYDDALIIDAYLASGRRADLRRAEVLGDSLLFVQANDPAADGRIRAAYAPTPLANPSRIKVVNGTSDVGNMAWVGMALARLYARTGNAADLDGAVSIGNWIQTNANDTRGAGGYSGGQRADGEPITWKSTEHNIDAYALFQMLAIETGDSTWTTRAAWARGFIDSMWDATDQRFFTGTGNDGVTVNDDEQPEDVNTWSYLALQDPQYAAALDWDVSNLAVQVDGFNGVSFCAGDRTGVWFEGTAHLAAALALRNGASDATRAHHYLSTIRRAQASGPNADGQGIIAASKDQLSDCDGDFYYASLHTGATAWYLLAAQASNPFTLP